MKSLLVLSIALLVVLMVKPSTAQDVSHEDQLKAWGDDFVGSWASETTLDLDVPGLGKKGDALSGEVQFESVNGVYRGTWNGTVNGKPVDAGVAAIGWDASRKKVQVQWFTKTGAAAIGAYTRTGKNWRMKWTLHSHDGTKSTNTAKITINKDRHVHLLKNRKHGEEALPDKEEIWTRR